MGAPASSFTAVIAALVANALVAVLKLAAFAVSGSGAMLAEAIHSSADFANQGLLFLGLKRGARTADEEFQYGYGGERFVFGLLSAAGIFFVGCGLTIRHAIHSFMHPEMPELGLITWVVLAASFVIEGGSLFVAIRAVANEAGERGFFKHLRDGADPAALAILAEDGAALLGLVFATIGILLAYTTGNPMWDALGSMLVGVILGCVAVFLVTENRELLLGKAIPADTLARFVEVVRASPAVRALHDVRTRQITPESFHLKAQVQLSEDHLARQLDTALPRVPGLEGPARDRVLGQLAARALASINEDLEAVEDEVRRAIPQASHIDLEVDPVPDEPSSRT